MSTALKIFSVSLLLIFNVGLAVFSQKQASIWYLGNGNGIDFNVSPPSLITNAPEEPECYITISDKDGNLLFYCNSKAVWNADHKIMENGSDLEGSPWADKLIVPRPGNETQFYIFYVKEGQESTTNSEVLFSLVDMVANRGSGKVILKNELLYKNLHGSITAGGNCETGYWLVGETGTNIIPSIGTDLIYAFKIDEDSVHRTPVISEPVSIGASTAYRLSPNGDKLYFSYSGNFVEGSAIADFNLETGKVENFKDAGPCCGVGEFSADGRYLYIAYWELTTELMQYDLTQPELEGKLIADSLYIHQMRLAPDGKIYVLYNESKIPKMAIINKPDQAGPACDFNTDVGISVDIVSMPFYLPESAMHLLYQGPNRIDAGPDMEVCSGDPIVIGGVNDPIKKYSWFPEIHLDHPDIQNPTFSYLNLSDTIAAFTYHIQSCETDMMKVKVFPRPHNEVFGSKSVCPAVELVDYWVDGLDSLSYVWSVDGGFLAQGQRTDSIKVNWGKTNSAAWVEVIVNNQYNCPQDPVHFPVRINVELQTETPIGNELLCSNLATCIPYQITNTNGSVYTWESDYGNILNGQGTNKIKVDWPGDGKYHLWVKEQSTTIDTVCYGVSDSLIVNLFTDSTKLEIDYSGVKHEDPGSYELQWFVGDTARIIDDIQIFTATELNPDWILKDATNKTENYLSFPDTTMNYAPMTFKISSTNGCQELVESEIHTTILLEGIADSSSNSMTLSWTPYTGWDNIEQYEVWYSKDNEGQLIRVASFKPGQYLWTNSWGADAFDHHYRIRARHGSYPFESWSNQLTLSFDHPLEIPNVFTPNGDGINDTFDFPNLELYHENELQVYDRNGAEVYFKSDYDGEWTGGNLSSGVYYYSFTEKRNQKTYKGWVQILR